MKTVLIVAAVFLCLLASCASHKPAKPSEVKVSSAKISSDSQKLEATDDFKIVAAVYGYLLDKHPWDNGEYTAIFLDGSNARVSALIKKFSNHAPPLKPRDREQLRPNAAPIDKDTGKPGLILSAKAVDPTNGVSEAIGTWYGGEAATGLYAFVLVEVNGEWTIQSVK